jgi:phosphosulfolactate synthase
VTPDFAKKLEICRRHDIDVWLGGMLFELAFVQGRLDAFRAFLSDHGITKVEVSNGSLPIAEADKHRETARFVEAGFEVLSEVGCKETSVHAPARDWAAWVSADLAAGASYVILEGRADATAGLYANGCVRHDILEALDAARIDRDRLVFETPTKPSMAFFVKRFGTAVNLANVPLHEAINVETLRLGLRGDTAERFHGRAAAERGADAVVVPAARRKGGRA